MPVQMLSETDAPFRGCSVDRLDLPATSFGREVQIEGWVLGAVRQVVAVEAVIGEQVVERATVNRPRPDVAASFPDVPLAGTSGFEMCVWRTRAAGTDIDLVAVFENQDRVVLAKTTPPFEEGDDRAPSVSVVIPCYRQAHLLAEAITSALQQGYPKVEVVVVDDGSPDNTEEVARRFPGVTYLRQPNQGLAAARNVGFAASCGDFVVFLDADDRLLPEALTLAVSYLCEHPECGMVAGHFRFIGPNGVILASPIARAPSSEHFLGLVRDYCIGPPGVMVFRRTALDRIGGFDSSVGPAADYDIALRVASQYPIWTHDRVVLEYRRHDGNMSGNPASMLDATMTVLYRLQSRLATTEQGRLAYEAGLQHWRQSWGNELVQRTAHDIRQRRVMHVIRGGWTLLKHYPAGVSAVLKAVLDPDEEDFQDISRH